MSRHHSGILLAIVCVVASFLEVSSSDSEKYGVLAAESSSHRENFCIIYFPEFAPLPAEKSKAEFHLIEDALTLDLCEEPPTGSFKAKIVLLNQHNCSLAKQARLVQEKGGIGAVFISPKSEEDDRDDVRNASTTEDVSIIVALISQNSVERLKEMNETVSVKMFSPEGYSFDFSLPIIWVLAMLSVCIGGYWSGLVRADLYSKEMNKAPENDGENSESDSTSLPVTSYQEESSLSISPYAVAAFVMCMGGTLLLLYFFFDYLVYFLIGLFVIVSVNSVYACLYPIVMNIFPRGYTVIQCHLMSIRKSIDAQHLLLFIIAVSAAVSWVITREEKFSWILQDLLGVLFCINMLKSIRMPNLKICTLLLTLLFFYDIFFVFVTPFFTAKGGSIMEEVATGGPSKKALPMLIKVPHFNFNPLAVCYQRYSLLGLGDILVPGLLISYCHGFDMITSSNHTYYILVVIAYGIGMILTFIGVNLMGTAQPALLYLVPSTLIPPILLGWGKGELRLLWNGFPGRKTKTAEIQPETSATAPSNDSTNDQPIETNIIPEGGSGMQENNKESSTEVMNERKHLLR